MDNQADKSVEKVFKVRKSASLFWIIVPICLFIIAIILQWLLGIFLSVSLFLWLLYSTEYQIRTDESGVLLTSPSRECRIKWQEIRKIRASFLGVYSIYGESHGWKSWFPSFLTGRKIRVNHQDKTFQGLLEIVLKNSVNADIDWKVYELLRLPNIKMQTRYSWIFAGFFTLYSIIYSCLLIGFTGGNFSLWLSLGWFFVAYSNAVFCIPTLRKWSDNKKWRVLHNLYFLTSFLFFVNILAIHHYNSALWMLLILVAASWFTAVIFWFPEIRLGRIGGMAVLFAAIVFAAGKAALHNPHVEQSWSLRESDFMCSSLGWFPGGDMIWLEGSCGSLDDSNGRERIILIVNAESGEIVHRMTGDFLGHLSFFWRPQGEIFGLLEYREDRRVFSIVDSESFTLTEIALPPRSRLHRHRCWNQAGDKLAGYYLVDRPGEKCERDTVAFIYDMSDQQIHKITHEETDRIITVFWLPDDSVGILQAIESQDGVTVDRRRLYHYRVSRWKQGENEIEEIYYTEEAHLSAEISPGGKFLRVKTAQKRPLFVDLADGREAAVDEKWELRKTRSRDAGWTPNDSAALLPVVREEEPAYLVYDTASQSAHPLPSSPIGEIISHCDGFDRFLGYSADYDYYPPLIVLNRSDSTVLKIARDTLFFGGSFLGMGTAAINPQGDRVVYANSSFGLTKQGIRFAQNVYLAAIKEN